MVDALDDSRTLQNRMCYYSRGYSSIAPFGLLSFFSRQEHVYSFTLFVGEAQ